METMEEKRKKLADALKSIVTDSPLFEGLQSELNENNFKAKIFISPQKGIQVRVDMNIPKWEANFSASHPINGGFYIVRFEDGTSGMVNIKTDKTFAPLCKLTDAYKDKNFHSFDDAVEALYVSIMKYGSPEYKVKS
jgi:hypothetical protein